MADATSAWDLPLHLGCNPNLAAPEKKAQTLVLQPETPRQQTRSSAPRSVTEEQRRNFSQAIATRLTELHQGLLSDHERICGLQVPPAGIARGLCAPTSGRKLPSISTSRSVNSYTQTDSRGLRNVGSASWNPNLAIEPSQFNLSLSNEPEAEKGTSRQGSKDKPKRQSSLFSFANTDDIKEKVRSAKLKKLSYNVHSLYNETGRWQEIARHSWFENLTLSIIVFNAFWIAVDTDGNTADTINSAEGLYVFADVMFFGYFSTELFIRYMAFRRKWDCLTDGWFVFDSCLVGLYAFDPFAIGIIAALSGGGGLNLPTAVLRLFRLARLSRLIRMLRSLPELMIMIKGMLSAAASVGYTLGLLLLITYVFSIALRNIVPDDDDDESIKTLYFSSVLEAMHNLIVYGTFLDNLADFIMAVKEQSSFCFVLTWIYIAMASLTVMNMLIGVLCEVVAAVALCEKESMMVDKVHELFGKIIHNLDTNNDGTLSWDEFVQILEYPDALKALEQMNVDPESMVDMAEDFFFEDNEPVSVTFEEFMNLVLDLRGGQQATVKDIMGLGKRVSKKFLFMQSKIERMEGKIFGDHSSNNYQRMLADAPQVLQESRPLEAWQGYCCKKAIRTFTHICRVTGSCGSCGTPLQNARAAHYDCECCGSLPYCEKCNGGAEPDGIRKAYLKQSFSAITNTKDTAC